MYRNKQDAQLRLQPSVTLHRELVDRRQRFAGENSVRSTPTVGVVPPWEPLQIAKCAAMYCAQQLHYNCLSVPVLLKWPKYDAGQTQVQRTACNKAADARNTMFRLQTVRTYELDAS